MGSVFVENFDTQEQSGGPQNWALAQSSDGVLYVGNGRGVLQFDGVSWRATELPNRTRAVSLAIDRQGRVLVGSRREFGYLTTAPLGATTYVSLSDTLPAEERDFADVTQIVTTEDGAYFAASDRVFHWAGDDLRVRRMDERFRLFAVDGMLLFWKEGKGFVAGDAAGDEQGPPLDSGTFAEETVLTILRHSEESDLVLTDTDLLECPRLLTSSVARACAPFAPELEDALASLRPTTASHYGEFIAIGTLRGGVLLLDDSGALVQRLDETRGLRQSTVRYSLEDREGGLWLALDDGLARASEPSISRFGKELGLEGIVLETERHRGQLYAATTLGVYRLVTEGALAGSFERLDRIGSRCAALLSTPEGLLAGCDRVYDVEAGTALTSLSPSGNVYSLLRSKRDPALVYVGLASGLRRLRRENRQWIDAGPVADVDTLVRSMVEDAEGRLWMGTPASGILRLDAGESAATDRITRYGSDQGLPTGWINVSWVAGEPLFLHRSGAFRWTHPNVPASEVRFERASEFEGFFSQQPSFLPSVVEDSQGRLWISAGELSSTATPRAEGGYEFAPSGLRTVLRNLARLDLDEDGTLWASAANRGLIRVAPGRDAEVGLEPFGLLLRSVTDDADEPLPLNDAEPSVWPYLRNEPRFTFAAPRFTAAERTFYRHRLDGLDEGWSTWSERSSREYTNLWEGEYVFRVQAKDVFGQLSEEASFSFRVEPPWFRTRWAYLAYVLLGLALLALYRRRHRQQLQRAQERADREEKINRDLREVDRLKDEFLANTSHELRTPLYGISGIAEALIGGSTGSLSESTKSHLDLLNQSAKRLSALVDDLLDFSRLRRERLQVELRPVDLHSTAETVLRLADPLRGSKELVLKNRVPRALPAVMASADRLQQILVNLVDNAVRFTESGTVEIYAEASSELVTVEVRDTGIGISQEEQEKIFEAFQQVDASIERAHGGVGLGLSVARQLVALHGSELSVTSLVGEGSTFRFDLKAADEPADVASPELREPPPRLRHDISPEALESAATAGRSSTCRRLLIVDDDPVNLVVLRDHLADEGYELVLASSGAEALERLDTESFDLVLLDVMMPQMSGFEVCSKLRETFPMAELPVLFLTAKNRDSDVATGMAHGANDYLTKPISKEALLARIRPHLELRGVLEGLESLVEERLAQIKVLRGLLPVCAQCKKVRDDDGYWGQIDAYIAKHTEADVTHGMCPGCIDEFYPELEETEV